MFVSDRLAKFVIFVRKCVDDPGTFVGNRGYCFDEDELFRTKKQWWKWMEDGIATLRDCGSLTRGHHYYRWRFASSWAQPSQLGAVWPRSPNMWTLLSPRWSISLLGSLLEEREIKKFRKRMREREEERERERQGRGRRRWGRERRKREVGSYEGPRGSPLFVAFSSIFLPPKSSINSLLTPHLKLLLQLDPKKLYFSPKF